jgi:uncharacterized protein YcnI
MELRRFKVFPTEDSMRKSRTAVCLAAFLLVSIVPAAFGHVRISPRESSAGATQKYTMTVPTERQSPTIRIEATFPASVMVVSFGAMPGWKIEEKKDGDGKIVGAVWSGGAIPFAESVDFTFEAKNPAAAGRLEWKVIQIYQDGARSEWTGPENSRTPGPVTTVK